MSNGNRRRRDLTDTTVDTAVDARFLGVSTVLVSESEYTSQRLALRLSCEGMDGEAEEVWIILRQADVEKLRAKLRA